MSLKEKAVSFFEGSMVGATVPAVVAAGAFGAYEGVLIAKTVLETVIASMPKDIVTLDSAYLLSTVSLGVLGVFIGSSGSGGLLALGKDEGWLGEFEGVEKPLNNEERVAERIVDGACTGLFCALAGFVVDPAVFFYGGSFLGGTFILASSTAACLNSITSNFNVCSGEEANVNPAFFSLGILAGFVSPIVMVSHFSATIVESIKPPDVLVQDKPASEQEVPVAPSAQNMQATLAKYNLEIA